MRISGLLTAATYALAGTLAQADDMKMSVTTSFHNSGLAEVLLPEIQKDLGLEVQLLVVGTGQALRLGEAGDVDAILVHSKAAEEEFVAAGYGTHRTEIMYNDFVIVGPSEDPADISGAPNAIEALTRIAKAQTPFVSRGDDSGTDKMEKALWIGAGYAQEALDVSWYNEAGAGMGAALNTASGMNAYILSDRASWLNFGNKRELGLLFQGDPVLFNQYAYLPVNPQKHGHVKSTFSAKLEAWLVSDRAKALIDGYMLEGEQLFVFNAEQ